MQRWAVLTILTLQETLLSDSSTKNEADLEGILSELSTVFDPSCKFHLKNQDEPLPKSVEEYYERSIHPVARGYWAASTPNPAGKLPSSDEEENAATSDTVDLTLDAAPQHEWIAFLISYFAHLGGLEAVSQVTPFALNIHAGSQSHHDSLRPHVLGSSLPSLHSKESLQPNSILFMAEFVLLHLPGKCKLYE